MTREKIIEMIEAHIIDAIEHCADVEYYDTVKDLDVGHFLTIHEIFEVAQYAAINMDDELINHEQDLLKEFVEWLKDRFDKRIDEQTAKYERIENEYDDGTNLTSYMEYVAYNEGILTGFVNAKWWLEELDTIEKFLEENKDVEPNESI